MKFVYIARHLTRDEESNEVVIADRWYFSNNKLAREFVQAWLDEHTRINDGCPWKHEQAEGIEAWTCPHSPLQFQVLTMALNPTITFEPQPA